ncbi:hypothetical protein R2103_02695 [Nitrosomonas sp. Is24]|uniref:hypothetical protein n=1 Tax=Nitrosomonas sp. Is24 TaxID=3080533 RepID=UPI00294B3F92|nr:hypothetical protein [Nitrosomonas sp. Is24]MDV6340675.1 hypothetical protein [Nitrosomonas sp. Is24]
MEFDPIFSSQDAAAMEITINSLEDNNIIVRFIYPPNGIKINLLFQLEKTNVGWRIDDIVYGENAVSLKMILSR